MLKIKVVIADRVYPISVTPEQEEGLRKASKTIETMIKSLEDNYAVRDKQDVLAMCALQLATEWLQAKEHTNNEAQEAQERLASLHVFLQNTLSK